MKTTAMREFLATLHPYDDLDSATLDAVVAKVQPQSYVTHQRVYEFGDRLAGLYIVIKGHVEITDATGGIISVLGRGNSFGERGLLSDGLAVTNAEAHDDVELALIPSGEFHNLIEIAPSVERFFDRRLRSRNQRLDADDLSTTQLGDLMTKSVITIAPDASLREATSKMNKNKIAALVVCDKGKVAGVLTLRDVLTRLLAADGDQIVRDAMSSAVVSLASDALAVDAILLMSGRGIGHLPIIDNDTLVGIVTKTNLLSQGGNSVMTVITGIGKAATPEAMRQHVDKLPSLLAQMSGIGVAPHVVTRLLTDIADAATRRLIVLFEQAYGAAPAPYVFGALGSQGRQEQTGVSDQDNCIIYADGVDDPSYYKGLAQFVSDGLDGVGYYYCPGSMMATTPKWCQPVATWREYFKDWIIMPDEEAQVLASVMFDLRAIYGKTEMLEELRTQVLADASDNSIFQSFLASNSLKHQPPLSLFRGLSTIDKGEHKNTIDMKMNGVVPITDLARLYAIKGRIPAANTRARLQDAIHKGIISESGGNDLITALDIIAEARLRHQTNQIRNGEAPNNFLDPSSLTELERSHLRDAFVVVKSFQSALRRQLV